MVRSLTLRGLPQRFDAIYFTVESRFLEPSFFFEPPDNSNEKLFPLRSRTLQFYSRFLEPICVSPGGSRNRDSTVVTFPLLQTRQKYKIILQQQKPLIRLCVERVTPLGRLPKNYPTIEIRHQNNMKQVQSPLFLSKRLSNCVIWHTVFFKRSKTQLTTFR